ncbi:AraC family transcriptional regulator [Tatumella citrea]|uniref:AraC family transcriptional regulator n=1 Tax=Tatumella citrea TaxID=53336 RepID=A0A1Y0LLA2_TATCI|nr:helix-turn-helix domain-containing protein [Tatumella citrea]ARU94411.1 AraC family transcriptional regulator [Tatumella citrea]ARU98450.1 AraC family transcriptional regulator [Tatumella citrea]
MQSNSYVRSGCFQPEQPWFVLNAARHYSLLGSANPAISHFYSFDIAPSAEVTLAVPDGCVDIVFDCDALNPCGRVCGTTLEARGADMKHHHHYFGVRFAPGVIPDFLDVSAGEIPDREFSFMDVVPDARQAFELIIQTSDFQRKIALFNAFFTPRLVRKSSPLTSQVINTMQQYKGNIRIDELETLTGYSCRTIQRQFRQDTGLSPKAFCKILRCQSALNSLHSQQSVSFSDLAFDLGFSDQSHFLREFKKSVSTTPGDYQKHIAGDKYQHRLRFH